MSDTPQVPTEARDFGPGAWFYALGVWMFIPEGTKHEAICEAADMLDRLWNEAYLRQTADCGGT